MNAPRATPLLYLSCFCAILAAAPLHADEKALVDAGLPPINRAWNGRDYTRTATLLASGKVPLPRYADATGRLFLQRLTAVDNLAFSSDEKMPLDSRFSDFLNLLSGANSIRRQYDNAINRGEDVHAESARLLAFTLRTAAVGMPLVVEMILTLQKHASSPARTEGQMEGLKKMHSGLIAIFSGTVQSLSETSIYDPQDLSMLLDAMAETLPTLKTGFSDGYRLELRQKLEADKAVFPQPKDAQDIQKMIGELGQ